MIPNNKPINNNQPIQQTAETTPVSNWFSDSWNNLKSLFSGYRNNGNNPNTQGPNTQGPTGTGGKKNKSMHKKSKHRKSKKGGRK